MAPETTSVRQPPRPALDPQFHHATRPIDDRKTSTSASVTPQPRVSVLMTAYNREAYIAAAIESVLAQTMTDFELIVCDDASHDGTVEIASGYARRDARVRVVVAGQNIGDYPNRNRAAALARGAYLKYHDSDDVMYPHCLSVMVGYLDAEPRAMCALSGSRDWRGGPCPMLLTPRLSYEREFLGSGLFHLGPSAGLFRRRAFLALGGFPVAGAASDYRFWVGVCTSVNVLLVPGDLFFYRIHAGQQLANGKNDAEYDRAVAAAWAMLEASTCPLDHAAREQAKKNFLFTVLRGAYRTLKQGRLQSAASQVRHAGPGVGDWIRYLRVPRRLASAGTPSHEEARA